MADYATTAENLRRMAVQYQSMVAAADLIEKIGSFEQATRAAEAATQAARDKLAEVNAELKAVAADRDAAIAEAAGVRERATTEARQVSDDAILKAESIIETGKAQAQAIVADANAEAEKVHAAQELRAQLMGEQIASLQAQVESAAFELDVKKQAITDAQAKLDSINAAIAEILAKASPQA